MSVPAVVAGITYNCNGSTTNFNIPFTYLQSSYVLVRHYDYSLLDTFTLTLGVDYTISGGDVITSETYPTNDKIVLSLNIPMTQETDFLKNGVLDSDLIEAGLDKLTLLFQQRDGAGTPSIRLAFPESPEPDLTLPAAAERALRTVMFDSSGDLVLATLAATTMALSAFMQDFLLLANAAEARTDLSVYSESEVDALITAVTGLITALEAEVDLNTAEVAKMPWSNEAISGAYDEDDVFELLSPYVPSAADKIPITGRVGNAGSGATEFYVATYLYRESATRVTIGYLDLSGIPQAARYDDDDATTIANSFDIIIPNYLT